MTQKTTPENSKREAILAEALPLFLENGYEKTSIRMIAGKVGCEVGLVYYYFSTKEDVFENAISLYFENKNSELSELTEKTKKDASLFIDTLFSYLEKEAPAFAETFSESVHWTIRSAVRAKFVDLVKTHIAQAVHILADRSRMPYSADITAKVVAELVVNAALDDDENTFSASKDELRRIAAHILGVDKTAGRRKDIPSFLL